MLDVRCLMLDVRCMVSDVEDAEHKNSKEHQHKPVFLINNTANAVVFNSYFVADSETSVDDAFSSELVESITSSVSNSSAGVEKRFFLP